jgi:hypothetical protein
VPLPHTVLLVTVRWYSSFYFVRGTSSPLQSVCSGFACTYYSFNLAASFETLLSSLHTSLKGLASPLSPLNYLITLDAILSLCISLMPRNGWSSFHNKKLSSSFYHEVFSLYDGKPGGFLIKNKNIGFSPHSHPPTTSALPVKLALSLTLGPENENWVTGAVTHSQAVPLHGFSVTSREMRVQRLVYQPALLRMLLKTEWLEW